MSALLVVRHRVRTSKRRAAARILIGPRPRPQRPLRLPILALVAALATASRTAPQPGTVAGRAGLYGINIPTVSATCGQRIAKSIRELPTPSLGPRIAKALRLSTDIAPRRADQAINALARDIRPVASTGRRNRLVTRTQSRLLTASLVSRLRPFSSSGRPTAIADTTAAKLTVAVQTTKVVTLVAAGLTTPRSTSAIALTARAAWRFCTSAPIDKAILSRLLRLASARLTS